MIKEGLWIPNGAPYRRRQEFSPELGFDVSIRYIYYERRRHSDPSFPEVPNADAITRYVASDARRAGAFPMGELYKKAIDYREVVGNLGGVRTSS